MDDDLPALERVPDTSEAPRIVMSWEDGVRERLACFVEEAVCDWLGATLRPGRRLRPPRPDEELSGLGITFLELDELARLLAVPGLTGSRLEGLRSVGDVIAAAVQGLDAHHRGTFMHKPPPLLFFRASAPATVFSLEFTRVIAPRMDELLDPGVYPTNDVAQFAELRRLWRERREAFSAHWLALSEKQMRETLFRAAPLPLDETDEDFPVSIALLPRACVSYMMGPHLLLLLDQRVGAKYAAVSAADLQHARAVAPRFVDRYPGKSFSVERRRFVSSARYPSQGAGLIEGRVFGVFNAMMSSIQTVLLQLLHQFDAEMKWRRRERASKKQTHCDVCGAFAAKLSVCSKCKARRYCSVACQKKDWSDHRTKCGISIGFSFQNDSDSE